MTSLCLGLYGFSIIYPMHKCKVCNTAILPLLPSKLHKWYFIRNEFSKVFRETSELQHFILILEILWFWFQRLTNNGVYLHCVYLDSIYLNVVCIIAFTLVVSTLIVSTLIMSNLVVSVLIMSALTFQQYRYLEKAN